MKRALDEVSFEHKGTEVRYEEESLHRTQSDPEQKPGNIDTSRLATQVRTLATSSRNWGLAILRTGRGSNGPGRGPLHGGCARGRIVRQRRRRGAIPRDVG